MSNSTTDLTMAYKPLSEEEIAKVTSAIREQNVSPFLRFIAITLKEPNRSAIVKDGGGSTITTREAEVVTLDPTTGLANEYVVKVEDGRNCIVSHSILSPGLQPMFTPDDCDLAEEIVQASNLVAQVLKERYGIADVKEEVACDPWSINFACDQDRELLKWRCSNTDDSSSSGGTSVSVPARLVQTFLYRRQYGKGLEDNHYAHPIDLVPVVDLNARRVVKIDGMDRSPPPQIPTDSVNYHRNLLKTNTYLQTTWRNDVLKTLNVEQPDGPSFAVTNDNHVEWSGWSFDVGFNYREGLVLHNVKYDDRSVLRRASLVEMAVPYGDPYPPHQRKCAFDVGDYGLGYCANSLELGCDCLGRIHYFDGVLINSEGEPQRKKKVICMHEEDNGILWKHVEYRNGHNESRRSRELVISFIATVVNYEYLFYWRLKQDGMIEFEIKLSGELSTNLPAASEDPNNPTHGVLVSPGVNAQIHQHMFCARLDMAVDGFNNKVSEIDVVSQPLDPVTNPYGNCFQAMETPLESEKSAIRVADPTKARTWKISNTTKKNLVNGKPTAYKLVPFTKGPAQPIMLVNPSSAVGVKGAFAMANLWVTPYSEKERFPAGEYVTQGDGSDGLPDWTAHDRSLVDASNDGLVLWHAFGVCHLPRTEDFPVMPCEITGFTLKPDNFFNGNPAIDLPPELNSASKLTDSCCTSINGCNGNE